ncbi:Ubiquitin-conjugating enzyme [Carpediemonas membranifera]|uniref:Ubiquitin-conjugating enzyme n=1 Tax=Carpediemonas membranifera TaxID=201153 RepID=A0A8J6BBA9_9EUKA|nr:Ubiquitin-conjugating enzyme [Carpediemonas membranifera]|eukprot:KAG9397169.1 Ubiquitin-conjugating enzyme [Carpediemonas membranifera]
MVLPRNFRLLEELERSEKGMIDDLISFGLNEDDPEDRTLSRWNATIIGAERTQFFNRIYNLSLFCGAKYPSEPPQVRFLSCINAFFVNESGLVLPDALPILKNWRPESTMEDILKAIAAAMATAPRKPQPVEGSCYQ